jgi:hypothetical protein
MSASPINTTVGPACPDQQKRAGLVPARIPAARDLRGNGRKA